MTKVSGQFIHGTIPQSRDCGCARCQMLEVKIEQLQQRMQGWDKAINVVKIEALEEIITKQKTIYRRFLFWAETKALLIIIGSILTTEVIILSNSFFIRTFSSRNLTFGFNDLTCSNISANRKNKAERLSSKASCLPANENP